MPLFLAKNMKAFPILQRLRIIGVRLTKIDETLSVGKFFMLERLYGCTRKYGNRERSALRNQQRKFVL